MKRKKKKEREGREGKGRKEEKKRLWFVTFAACCGVDSHHGWFRAMNTVTSRSHNSCLFSNGEAAAACPRVCCLPRKAHSLSVAVPRLASPRYMVTPERCPSQHRAFLTNASWGLGITVAHNLHRLSHPCNRLYVSYLAFAHSYLWQRDKGTHPTNIHNKGPFAHLNLTFCLDTAQAILLSWQRLLLALCDDMRAAHPSLLWGLLQVWQCLLPSPKLWFQGLQGSQQPRDYNPGAWLVCFNWT